MGNALERQYCLPGKAGTRWNLFYLYTLVELIFLTGMKKNSRNIIREEGN